MTHKLYLSMVCLAMGLVACSEATNKDSKQQSVQPLTVMKEQILHQLASMKSEHASCNLYLETYDAYLEEYVRVTENMQESSLDTTLIHQLKNLQQKRNDLSHPLECNDDPYFIKKYNLINKKFLQ